MAMESWVRLREKEALLAEPLVLAPRRRNDATGRRRMFIGVAAVGVSGRARGKRLFDIVVSAAGLIVLSPLLAIIWLVVIAASPGSAFFLSPRVGRFGRIFIMPKFRTMPEGSRACAREALSDGEAGITGVGRLLRRTGLDELPQLWCVLRGDMSLLGPRPLVAIDPCMAEREKFPDALDVRPGISGLAQVSGRNLVSPRRKARLDAFYARTGSLGFDLILLARTLVVIVTGKGFL